MAVLQEIKNKNNWGVHNSYIPGSNPDANRYLRVHIARKDFI